MLDILIYAMLCSICICGELSAVVDVFVLPAKSPGICDLDVITISKSMISFIHQHGAYDILCIGKCKPEPYIRPPHSQIFLLSLSYTSIFARSPRWPFGSGMPLLFSIDSITFPERLADLDVSCRDVVPLALTLPASSY